jgi:hypothetical protein
MVSGCCRNGDSPGHTSMEKNSGSVVTEVQLIITLVFASQEAGVSTVNA